MKTTAAPRLIRRFAGLILLAVFGAGQLSLLPLLAAAVAVLDGEHRVELMAGSEGVRLALRHDHGPGGDVTQLPAWHHHGGLMRIIAGDDARGPHPDHQLLFTAASSLAKEQETRVPAATFVAVSVLAATNGGTLFPALCQDRSSVRPGTLWHSWWPPPPAECAWGCVVLLV